jgi:hypothetical protein
MSGFSAALCIILMHLFLNSVLHKEVSYGRFHYDNWHRKKFYVTNINMRLDVLMAVNIKITYGLLGYSAVWDVTPCSLVQTASEQPAASFVPKQGGKYIPD